METTFIIFAGLYFMGLLCIILLCEFIFFCDTMYYVLRVRNKSALLLLFIKQLRHGVD